MKRTLSNVAVTEMINKLKNETSLLDDELEDLQSGKSSLEGAICSLEDYLDNMPLEIEKKGKK
jgi:hypothetical protein